MNKFSPYYILVVDDEPDIRELIKEILVDEGYEVDTAENAQAAMLARTQRRPDLVLLDIWLPDKDGISVLREWSTNDSSLFPVIMMSGHGSVETAVEATRLGAYDYIEKPLTTANLLLTIQNALKTSQLTQENKRLKSISTSKAPPIGSSMIMQELKRNIEKVAQHNAWVLISGEAGVGKETFAHTLHEYRPEPKGPFIEIRAASLLKENSSAELFGSEDQGKIHYGLLEQANGGTLLIDEISDMDMKTQARLYSALKTKRLHRVNGIEPVVFNVYIIATTHKNLAAAVAEGKFREDLYYELNVVPITVPALREHTQDIPELFEYYLQYFSERDSLPQRYLPALAQKHLQQYPWPGNIRELKNLVQRLLILGSGREISLEEIKVMLGGKPPESYQIDNNDQPPEKSFSALNLPLRNAREDFERQYFTYHLNKNGGNMAEVAKISGMERTHLYRKLKTLGIDIKSSKRKMVE